MFTGIVEEYGQVVGLDMADRSARVVVRGPLVVQDAAEGSSIAVNGVCLTVVDLDRDAGTFAADVMAETLNRSGLGGLAVGDPVNLERPVAAVGRLGGHIVQGHVDGTGTVLERTPGQRWELVRIGLPAALARYVVEKGSIAVDGVSLTVCEVAADSFTVSLIPETLTRTTLGRRAVGEQVNLEVDILAKYVERLVGVELPIGGVPR